MAGGCSAPLPYFLDIGVPTGFGAQCFCLQVSEPSGLLVSSWPPTLGLQTGVAIPSFYVGNEGSDLGPHAGPASILSHHLLRPNSGIFIAIKDSGLYILIL